MSDDQNDHTVPAHAKDRTIPICSRCGSTAILKDAWAQWDVDAQDWVLAAVFDYTICDDCGREASIEWRDPEAVAKPTTDEP